ncbi:MAG: hypothetical protein ACR2QQ_03585 [Gammaproteobacteria bacterium]
MDALYFTIVAIALYFIADWLLDRFERRLGHRLERRSLVFFAILLGLALASFALIRTYTGLP